MENQLGLASGFVCFGPQAVLSLFHEVPALFFLFFPAVLLLLDVLFFLRIRLQRFYQELLCMVKGSPTAGRNSEFRVEYTLNTQ